MKILIPILLITSFVFSQPPLTADSIYWTPKYCSTAETVEDCTNSWVFNGNFDDCIQPSEGFCKAIFPGYGLYDTYDCCCKATSLPGSLSALNGFFGGPCQEYLDSIGFIYDDPEYINWVFLEENILKLIGDIYIDIFGRIFNERPNGMYIKDGVKYLNVE